VTPFGQLVALGAGVQQEQEGGWTAPSQCSFCSPRFHRTAAAAIRAGGPGADEFCSAFPQEQSQHSQNHRMVGVGGDICGSSSPTLLPKQGHLQHTAEDLVQVGLEYLQRRRLHNLPGQPGPGLRHPQREGVLPHVQTELPLPQFVPIAPCPVTGHHCKESGPILLTPTLQIFRGISKVPSQPSSG